MDFSSLQRAVSGMNLEVIGYSSAGRPLYSLTMGQGKHHLLLASAFHGMEHLTTDLLIRYAKDCLCRKLPVRLTILPMVNPDGVEIQQHGWQTAGKFAPLVKAVSGGKTNRWQANARGVDLNHNFNAGWRELRIREIKAGITGPAATRFGGNTPESEPESAELAQLCRRERFTAAAALHTQGEEIYWNYGSHTPEISYEIAEAMAQVSGYTVAEPEGLAVGGGFKDWFLQEFHRPAFTIECGKGRNPLPNAQVSAIYAKVKSMLDYLLTVSFL